MFKKTNHKLQLNGTLKLVLMLNEASVCESQVSWLSIVSSVVS